LPIDIKGVSGETLRSDFSVVNILQIVDVISERKTIRSRVKMGARYPILKLAIIEKAVPRDVHAFRVAGATFDFIVDDAIKTAITRLPHDGLAFIPVAVE